MGKFRTYLDFGSTALDLAVGHLQTQLVDTTFNSIPAGQS